MLQALRTTLARCLAALLLLGVVPLQAWAADPPSVAVLPMEKGAGSAQYDGLGRALAGMLVSDLSTVPGLRLVERAQLDTLLAEMKLKESGFLDPKTAQKLGKGVGARYLVVGSYTVVEPKFLMDARIVEVQSGEIVKSQDAAGTVEDFVSVEKDLVEKLVANLDLSLSGAERRKLLASVPTEKFSAFKSYGEGLARQSEGKADEAKAAFGRALAEDPAYADARRALDDLAAAVAAVQTERRTAARAVTDAAHKKLLAEIPDERTRAAGYADTEQELIRWDARINVLRLDHQDCDLYAEMDHFLTRKDWKVGEKAEPRLAVGLKIYPEFKNRNFLPEDIDLVHPWILERLHDYLGTLAYAANDCFAPAKGLAILDELRKSTKSRGLDALPGIAAPPLGLYLDRLWAELAAGRVGATPELTARTKLLLAADPSPDMEASVGRILLAARATQRRRAVEMPEVAQRVSLIAAGKVSTTGACIAVAAQQSAAAAWLGDYSDGRWGYIGQVADDVNESSLPIWVPASDFGCIAGVPGRFTAVDDTLAFFAKARTQTDASGDADDCRGLWRDYDRDLGAAKAAKDLPALFTVDDDWATLLAKRCARE